MKYFKQRGSEALSAWLMSFQVVNRISCIKWGCDIETTSVLWKSYLLFIYSTILNGRTKKPKVMFNKSFIRNYKQRLAPASLPSHAPLKRGNQNRTHPIPFLRCFGSPPHTVLQSLVLRGASYMTWEIRFQPTKTFLFHDFYPTRKLLQVIWTLPVISVPDDNHINPHDIECDTWYQMSEKDMDERNEPSGDKIANVVLKQFDGLPTKRKPLNRGEGVREWVPLSGIVASGRWTSGEGSYVDWKSVD